jgi:hypothetical protein
MTSNRSWRTGPYARGELLQSVSRPRCPVNQQVRTAPRCVSVDRRARVFPLRRGAGSILSAVRNQGEGGGAETIGQPTRPHPACGAALAGRPSSALGRRTIRGRQRRPRSFIDEAPFGSQRQMSHPDNLSQQAIAQRFVPSHRPWQRLEATSGSASETSSSMTSAGR